MSFKTAQMLYYSCSISMTLRN